MVVMAAAARADRELLLEASQALVAAQKRDEASTALQVQMAKGSLESELHVTLKRGKPYDLWRLPELAAGDLERMPEEVTQVRTPTSSFRRWNSKRSRI